MQARTLASPRYSLHSYGRSQHHPCLQAVSALLPARVLSICDECRLGLLRVLAIRCTHMAARSTTLACKQSVRCSRLAYFPYATNASSDSCESSLFVALIWPLAETEQSVNSLPVPASRPHSSLIVYIIGSIPRAGWPFSVRKATRVSGSSAMVSSPIISVKLSIPYSSFAVAFSFSATWSFSSLGIHTIL